MVEESSGRAPLFDVRGLRIVYRRPGAKPLEAVRGVDFALAEEVRRVRGQSILIHDWNHPIAVAVVEVCGNTGYNWFDLPT